MRLILLVLFVTSTFILGYMLAGGVVIDTSSQSDNASLSERVQRVIPGAHGKKENDVTLEYRSDDGYAFQYPEMLTLENSEIILSETDSIHAVGVMRYIHEQWCDATTTVDGCQPLRENPGLVFGVIAMQYQDVVARYFATFADLIEPVTIGEHDALQFFAGIDGEGVVTMLVPINEEQKTLIIQYTYDELFNDVDDDGVYGTEQQKQVVDQVLHSLKLE